MTKLLIFDAFTLFIRGKNVANYSQLTNITSAKTKSIALFIFIHLHLSAVFHIKNNDEKQQQGNFLKKKNCQLPDGNNQISSGRSKWTSFFPSSSSSSAASWSSCRSSKSRRCCMLKDVWAIFQHLFCMFPFMQCHRDLMFWVGKRKKVVKKFGHNWSIFRKGR